MSDLFDIYQDNIKTVFARITRILDNISTCSAEKSESSLHDADNHVKEAERLVILNYNFNLNSL